MPVVEQVRSGTATAHRRAHPAGTEARRAVLRRHPPGNKGAATSVLVAASPLLDGVGGRYFEDCDEAVVGVFGARNGVAEYALDPEAAARLWQVSSAILAA